MAAWIAGQLARCVQPPGGEEPVERVRGAIGSGVRGVLLALLLGTVGASSADAQALPEPPNAASAGPDATPPPAPVEEPAPAVAVEVFTRPGCPHCVQARAFLDALAAERPELAITVHDVEADLAARERLLALAAAHGAGLVGVPAFLVGEQLIIGFAPDGTTEAVLRGALVREAPIPAFVDDGLCSDEDPCATAAEGARDQAVDVPFVGRLDVAALGLPLFTIALGLVDGFNPCAMWVLLFLLSLLVNLKDRRRMALVGGTFVVVSGLVYFAFMAAWLNFFWLLGLSRGVQVVLGLVALGVAAVNVKDFFAFKRGVSLSIPESAHPTIARRAKAVLRAENLAGSLVAVVGLALLVNAVELLCTAGLPAVYTQVLAHHALSAPAYYGYLALYNIAYMLDDGLMLAVAVATLSKRRLEEQGGRALKLVSGLVMGVLALLLLFKPAWLVW